MTYDRVLEIDYETRSDVDIRSHGVYRYMQSPNTDPLFASYKFCDDPAVYRWDASEPCPPEIRLHVAAGGKIKAHNAGFERLLWQLVLTPRYGWPKVHLEQFICTAATAASSSLPRALGDLASALGLPVQKDKNGMALIRRFSLPRKARKDEDPDGLYFNTPEEFPVEWEMFKDYCDTDVLTEASADSRMVPLSFEDQERWLRSERINDRGIRVDVASAFSALVLADRSKSLLDAEMKEVTNGYVAACSQVARLTQWIKDAGVDITSMGKAELEELLEYEDLPDNVRRAIELRQEEAKTSVAKLKSFLDRVGPDGRIRGAFLWRAAGTGRYSSLGAQLHNMPRPRKMFDDAKLDQRVLFQAIRAADPMLLKFLYGDVLGRTLWLLSDAIRGFLWAAPGHDLLVADYSGIEGAVAAWFCGETWKVDAMFDLIDDPELPDLYRRAAAGIYNTTTEELTKKDKRRQVGKVSELSLQYQGGVGAFYSMARGYSLKLDEVYEPVWNAADEERKTKAEKRYDECVKRGDVTTKKLSRKSWLAAELVKVGWRAVHPEIVASWKLLDEAVHEAIENPGRIVSVLKVKYVVKRGFLWCMLPSGRCLAYGKPEIRTVEVPWADKSEAPEKREKKPTPTALGVNSVTKKWERSALYGGLLLENIVQAISLDLLEHGIDKAEAAGYPVIAHVHDEIITEVPRGWGDVGEFERLICDLPEWAKGLPLQSSGWRGKRYRKD